MYTLLWTRPPPSCARSQWLILRIIWMKRLSNEISCTYFLSYAILLLFFRFKSGCLPWVFNRHRRPHGLIHAPRRLDRRSLNLIDAIWPWSMLPRPGRCFLDLIDAPWTWTMLPGPVLRSLALNDASWTWSTLPGPDRCFLDQLDLVDAS